MPEHARSPLSPRKPLSEALLFASNFLRHPNMLGSIIPSSRFLVDLVLESGGRTMPHLGGGGFNAARTLGRLGLRPLWLLLQELHRGLVVVLLGRAAGGVEAPQRLVLLA